MYNNSYRILHISQAQNKAEIRVYIDKSLIESVQLASWYVILNTMLIKQILNNEYLHRKQVKY